MSRPRFRPLLVVLIALAMVLPGLSAAAAGTDKPGQGSQGGTILVGAASRSVLPTVGGSTAYLEGTVPDPADATSLGAFVPEFDQGQIAVGNGDDRAFWVHDDVRVRAMALDDPTSREMAVLVASDLYMIFRADGDQIRREVEERLADWHPGGGPGRNRPVELIITATHNHHGPDTAFDVNHEWYDYMIDQMVDAVIEAIDDRQPATLRVASGEHCRPDGLGHNLPAIYTCPATGPKTDSTCESDDGATTDDPVLGQIRAGDHLRSSVGYLRIGSDVAFVMLPAEVAGELVMGLPAEFRSTPELWYEEPELHVAPEDFHVPGYVRARVPETYMFTVGLGNDQLGYAKSITDYRIGCVADLLGEPGACEQLHAIGAIEFSDGVAGETCKLLAEDPAAVDELVAQFGPDAAQGVVASCDYGQTLAQATGHYPETNSAGWDLGDAILAAVGRLTGNTDATEVNPDFPGYNDAFPPPPAG